MRYNLCEFNDKKGRHIECSHDNKTFYAKRKTLRNTDTYRITNIEKIVEIMEGMFLTNKEIDSAIVTYAAEKLNLS